VIDPSTDTMYFFAKGYFNGLAGPQGTLKGVYKLWALTIPTLAVVSGFPVEIGGPSDNDPTRYFVGGTVLQRPGLTTVRDSIIAGFGGHCDGFNFTGMLVAVSKTSATVTSVMAMEVSPGEHNIPYLKTLTLLIIAAQVLHPRKQRSTPRVQAAKAEYGSLGWASLRIWPTTASFFLQGKKFLPSPVTKS
jgi:hypothetical protein